LAQQPAPQQQAQQQTQQQTLQQRGLAPEAGAFCVVVKC